MLQGQGLAASTTASNSIINTRGRRSGHGKADHPRGQLAEGRPPFVQLRFVRLYQHGKMMPEGIHSSQLAEVELASEEAVKRLGGTVGWGAVGALALGPVGLLAGLLLGGNKKDVKFVAKFKDGRKMLATTDSKAFTQMKAAVF